MPLTVQQNNIIQIVTVAVPSAGISDLIYAGGGGDVFTNTLAPDIIKDGKQYHAGNPVIDPASAPVYKKCNKVNTSTETIIIEGAKTTRGLFVTGAAPVNDAKAPAQYFWDEVYTTPVGFHKAIASGTDKAKFSISGNVLKIRTGDVNIIPKIGDYLIIQKVNASQEATIPSSLLGYQPGSAGTSYSDGFSNMPVLNNTQTYQFKILESTFTAPSGIDTEYVLTLDKSITIAVGQVYGFVLLNRENTGLQKELFYDTFEQIEVHREQLLGDSYFNVSSVKPLGRKNHLNYNNAEYLGIQNLLKGIINSKTQKFADTPFLVFDINEEIKDRILPVVSDTSNPLNFEFHLPTVMFQEDVNNKVNILTNYGTVINDTEAVGKYSGLYLKTSPTGKRFGWVFYDLRIIVIDDAELTLALSYNSNRNYTLPAPIFNASGNAAANITSAVNLDVIGLAGGSVSPLVVILGSNHGLVNGTPVTIQDVKVKVVGTNQIINSSANGVKYIKRFYDDPNNSIGERRDRFLIYEDSAMSIPTLGNGSFLDNGLGNSGKVRGAALSHQYFFTYRIKNLAYKSILPYANITSFNFADSVAPATINNTTGILDIKIPVFTWQNAIDGGFDVTDLEIIIGKWEAGDINKPYEITGVEEVVVISAREVGPDLPNTISDLNVTIPKSVYNTFVGRIGTGIGAYDYFDNNGGNPVYDITANQKHYNITSGVMPDTLLTAEGKWTLGNISYKTQIEQYRAKIQIVIGAGEWNDTTNPSYDPNNTFLQEKYISEVAIVDPNDPDEKPIIYWKIAPPIKKTPDLDILLNGTIDF